MAFDEVVRSAVSRLGVVRVSNALNPLLYLNIFVIPICCSAAWLFADDPAVKYGLLIFAGFVALTFLAHYTRFALTDPDRLQSEEYLARKQELSIIERKGLQGPEIIPPSRDDRPTRKSETGFEDDSEET